MAPKRSKRAANTTAEKENAVPSQNLSETEEPVVPPSRLRTRTKTQEANWNEEQAREKETRKRKRKDAEDARIKKRAAVDAKKDAAISARIDELEQQLAAEKKRTKKYKKKAAQNQQPDPSGAHSESDRLIPRPSGQIFIQHDMQLEGQDDEFKRIRSSILAVWKRSGLDPMIPWTKHPRDKTGDVVRVARKNEPILERYPGDWATEAILIQHINNHIGYMHRRNNPKSTLSKRRAENPPGRHGKKAANPPDRLSAAAGASNARRGNGSSAEIENPGSDEGSDFETDESSKQDNDDDDDEEHSNEEDEENGTGDESDSS